MKNLWKKGILGILGIIVCLAMTTAVSAYSMVNVQDTNIELTTDDAVIPIPITYTNDGSDVDITVIMDASPVNDYTEQQFSIGGSVTPVSDVINFPVSGELPMGEITVSVNISGPDAVYIGSSTDNKNGEFFDITLTVTEAIPDKDTEIAPGLITEIDIEEDEVAPGVDVEFEVVLEAAEDERFEDVTITAWLEDVYGERLTDKYETGEFNLGRTDDDDEESRFMTIEVPEDADEEEYFLVVRVEGTEIENGVGIEGLLDMSRNDIIDVVRNEHSLEIQSVETRGTAAAGSTLDFVVTVLNNGNNDEDDVVIRVAVPELGISQASMPMTIEESEEITNYFTISIPQNAEANEYSVLVSAFNSKYTDVSQFSLDVSGTEAKEDSQIVVNTGDSIKSVGESGAVFTVSLTNTGSNARTLSLEASGVRNWGEISINPATVVVPAGSTKIVSVFVTADEGVKGDQQFSLFVREDSKIVDSISFTAEIDSDNVDTVSLTTALKWGIGILILVLVVAFVVWSWRREVSETSGKKKSGRKYY